MARRDREAALRKVFTVDLRQPPRPTQARQQRDLVPRRWTASARVQPHRIKKQERIIAIEPHGFKKRPIDKTIPTQIVAEIRAQRCAVLGTSNPECDHKDGHRDDWGDPSKLTVDDFQPLSSAANKAKRQACKECRETKRRFDAATLGFTVAQFVGNGVYEGSCVGCYWHDVRRFHAEVSK